MNPALNIELKDDNDNADPAEVEVVTKALNELQANVDARLKEVETKSANDNKLADRLDKLEAKMNRPGQRHDNDNEAEETKAAKSAFGTYLRNGKQGVSPLEMKSLIVSSDPQGGYLAPAEFSNEFIRDLLQYSPIRGLASVRETSSSCVIYPSRTGRSDAKWTGETQAQGTGEPTFGQVKIEPKEITTYVDISNQLLADSAGAAEAEVRMVLSEDFGLKEGTAFLKGAGPLQPEGKRLNEKAALAERSKRLKTYIANRARKNAESKAYWSKLFDEASARIHAQERKAKADARAARDVARKRNERAGQITAKRIAALERATANHGGDHRLVKLIGRAGEFAEFRQALTVARAAHGPRASLTKIAAIWSSMTGAVMTKFQCRKRLEVVEKLETQGGPCIAGERLKDPLVRHESSRIDPVCPARFRGFVRHESSAVWHD